MANLPADLVSRLNALAAGKHDDLSVADEAVNEIARLRHRMERIEKLAANNITGCGTCVSILEEIAHERRVVDVGDKP